MKKLIILFLGLLLLSNFQTQSQTFKVHKVIPNGYPILKAEIDVFDGAGDNITNFTKSDFEVLEEGISRVIKDVICPPVGVSRFSLVLTIDLSQSMNNLNPQGQRRWDISYAAANTFVNKLPRDSVNWECAITSFSNTGTVNQNFTNDKALLRDALSKLNLQSGTNYTAALLEDHFGTPGASKVARDYAQYKPIIIFLTDGNHESSYEWGPTQSGEVCDILDEIDADFYAITLGMPEDQVSTSIPMLAGCGSGHGKVFYDLITQEALDDAFEDILDDARKFGYQAPCTLEWYSVCDGGGNTEITYKPFGQTFDTLVVINDTLKPYFEITTTPMNTFLNEYPDATQTVTIKAKQNFAVIDGAVFSNPNFSIVDWGGLNIPDTLFENQSLTLTVKYTAPDAAKEYYAGTIGITGSACWDTVATVDAGWIWVEEVNMGGTPKGETTGLTKTMAFCNKSGKTIRITGSALSGADKSFFKISSLIANIEIPHDSCININYEFTPDDVREFLATIEITCNDGNTYTAPIYGEGGGLAKIEVIPEPGDFGHVRCDETSDVEFTITNIGALPLTITDYSFSNSDFSVYPSDPTPHTVEPGSDTIITVRYSPSAVGASSAVMTIESNADGNETLDIDLSGTKDDVVFSTSANTLDIGLVCPDSIVSTTITVTNDGDVAADISASGTNLNLPVNSWNVAAGASQNITVEVIPQASDGSQSGTLTLTDECGVDIIIPIEWEVQTPEIDADDINITVALNTPKTQTITVTNTSDWSITIDNYTFEDAQFTFNPDPGFPKTLAPGGTVDLSIQYLPNVQTLVDTFLILTGSPCNFIGEIRLIGNPELPTATIDIEEHQGNVDAEIQIPVLLRNKYKFAASNTTTISTEVTYNNTVLQAMPPTSTFETDNRDNTSTLHLDITGFNLDDNDDEIYTLYFKVLDGGESTALTFTGTESDKKNVNFVEDDGLFTVNPSTALIKINDFEEIRPGQVINIPLALQDIINISNANEKITTTLRFNKSVLEPYDNTPRGSINGDDRVITFEFNQPFNISGSVLNLGIFPFRVLLGTSDTATIYVENTQVSTGRVNFTEESGLLSVVICRDGSDRLFNPDGNAALLSPTPNPTSGITELQFEVNEKGRTELFITNVIGDKVLEIMAEDLEPGTYNRQFQASDLPSGTYMIVLKTPTRTFSKRLNIVK